MISLTESKIMKQNGDFREVIFKFLFLRQFLTYGNETGFVATRIVWIIIIDKFFKVSCSANCGISKFLKK